MNSLEDQLTEATRAAANTVPDGSAPPLRLPRTAFQPPKITARSRRILAPLAASVAVAALVVTAVAVRDTLISRPSPATAPTGAVAAGIPPYFVAITNHDSEAVVANSATGQVLSRVAVPAPDNDFVAVSGAADDRTFVLAAEEVTGNVKTTGVEGTSPARFYRLVIHPGGRPVLTRLPVPPISLTPPPARGGFLKLGSLALSPDGSLLAVEASSPPGIANEIAVVSLRTGHVTTLKATGKNSQFTLLTGPSWDRGNGLLAFIQGGPARPVPGSVQIVNLKNLSAREGITIRPAHQKVVWDGVLVSPDGSRLLLAGRVGRTKGRGTSYVNPVLYTVPVRHARKISHITGHFSGQLYPLWSNPDASLVIVARRVDGNVHITVAAYMGSKRIPLKLPADTMMAAW